MSDPPEYVVVVPVKPPAAGKSRLRELPPDVRRELAAAFALDAVSACLDAGHVARVLATTDDASFAHRIAALGCSAIPDGDARGLNPAVVQAVAEAGRRWPTLRPIALLADLPALRPREIDTVLGSLAAETAAFVADASGTGTTLYAAPARGFVPQFGVASAAAHEASGATPVAGDLPTLRRDVDDLDDLRAAVALGVGPHTAALVVDLPH